MVEVELVDADVDREVGVPRMILRELGGAGRQLTIFIGGVEMHAIQLAVEGHEPPRPMTHDLFRDVLAELDVTLERVVITELRESTYFAELHLSLKGQAKVVSSRPVRRGGARRAHRVPHVRRGGGARRGGASAPEAAADDVVEQFREFIDRVNPEDFAP